MLKSKKKQKERSAGDYKSLDYSFPCFAGFGSFLGGTNDRLADLWSQQ